MTTKVLTMLLVAASFAFGGCTTLTEYGSVRKEILRNDQGHVIGYKELLRNEQTGEVIAQVSLYAPMLDSSGALIGYEEQAKGGSSSAISMDAPSAAASTTCAAARAWRS